MFKPKYFKTQEFVSPGVYEARGEKAIQLMDIRILRLADALREEFGPATINNWAWKGEGDDSRKWSGLRDPSSPWFSPYSQHTFGRAVDMVFKNHSAEDIRNKIKTHPIFWLNAGGTESITLEDGVSWLHIDVRNNVEGVQSFLP